MLDSDLNPIIVSPTSEIILYDTVITWRRSSGSQCTGNLKMCENQAGYFGDLTIIPPLSASFIYTQGCYLEDDGKKRLTFIASVEGGNAPYYYSWDFDNDGTYEIVDSTSNTAAWDYDVTGSPYSAKLKVCDTEDPVGCIDTCAYPGCCFTTEAQIIFVYNEVTASITPDPVEICEGGELQLQGNPDGGNPPYTHEWTGDGAIYLSSTTIENPIFLGTAPAGTYTLTYTVTDSDGCWATDTVSVTVQAKPVVTFGDDIYICYAFDDTFEIPITSEAYNFDITRYTWTKNPPGPETGTLTLVPYDPDQPNKLEALFKPVYDPDVATTVTEVNLMVWGIGPCSETWDDDTILIYIYTTPDAQIEVIEPPQT